MIVVPPFALDQGGLWLASVRGLFVAALFLAYGTALFRCRLAGPSLQAMALAEAAMFTGRLRKLGISALLAALGLLCLWLMVQSWALAGTQGMANTLRQVPTVLVRTSFGHAIMLQAAGLLGALAILLFRKPDSETFAFAAFLAGCATIAHALHGHAAAMYDGFSPLLLCEMLHLLAGAGWLGSLVPLVLLLRSAAEKPALLATVRYRKFGTACVVTLAVTAFVQGYVLVGSLSALTGTAYGWMALVKLGLFAVLVGFAALNRYRFTHKTTLVRSILIETCFGLAIVLAATTLVMLPPGMHM